MREHNQTIRSRLARALRWAIEKLGGESDTELHARVLGVYAKIERERRYVQDRSLVRLTRADNGRPSNSSGMARCAAGT